MTRTRTLLGCTILAVCLAAPGGFAFAQQSGGLLDNLFNGGSNSSSSRHSSQQPAPQPMQQLGPQGGGGVDSRIDRIENALRQLTGQIEVLQHQNQMLQMQLKRMQDDTEYRFQQLGGGHGAAAGAARPALRGRPADAESERRGRAAAAGQSGRQCRAGRRLQSGDASQRAGRAALAGRCAGPGHEPLGSGHEQRAGRRARRPRGRRAARSDVACRHAAEHARRAGCRRARRRRRRHAAAQLPPPPPRNTSATGTQLATLPPSASPKDEYELAYGYVLHKDYGLAAQAFRDFLQKHPKEHLVPDAEYWLGESLYQQQSYDDAARSFLAVSTKYKHFSKAPDALLRLGQSLAALHHKEAACATLSEVKNKFPHASSSVKRGVRGNSSVSRHDGAVGNALRHDPEKWEPVFG